MIGDVSINYLLFFYFVIWILCCRGFYRRRFNVFGIFVIYWLCDIFGCVLIMR